MPTNDIVQIMTLIDWTRINTAFDRVNACPNLTHEIELFRYVHTKPRALIRKQQMLSTGKVVGDFVFEKQMVDFMKATFSMYGDRMRFMPTRITDDVCALVLTICEIENGFFGIKT